MVADLDGVQDSVSAVLGALLLGPVWLVWMPVVGCISSWNPVAKDLLGSEWLPVLDPFSSALSSHSVALHASVDSFSLPTTSQLVVGSSGGWKVSESSLSELGWHAVSTLDSASILAKFWVALGVKVSSIDWSGVGPGVDVQCSSASLDINFSLSSLIDFSLSSRLCLKGESLGGSEHQGSNKCVFHSGCFLKSLHQSSNFKSIKIWSIIFLFLFVF